MGDRDLMDAIALIRQCRGLGANFIAVGDHLRIQSPEPLPEDTVDALKSLKVQVLAELEKEHYKDRDCWVLEEWRRLSMPQWRRILRESIEQQDRKREEYARWMLGAILHDPEYKEPGV